MSRGLCLCDVSGPPVRVGAGFEILLSELKSTCDTTCGQSGGQGPHHICPVTLTSNTGRERGSVRQPFATSVKGRILSHTHICFLFRKHESNQLKLESHRVNSVLPSPLTPHWTYKDQRGTDGCPGELPTNGRSQDSLIANKGNYNRSILGDVDTKLSASTFCCRCSAPCGHTLCTSDRMSGRSSVSSLQRLLMGRNADDLQLQEPPGSQGDASRSQEKAAQSPCMAKTSLMPQKTSGV